jgi:HrpA-like RNA helicase
MRGIRANLSAYKYRGDLQKAFNSCSVTIVCGQTSCGKSTQVPQYVLEDYIEMGKGAECNIICTQSRRLSAIGLADHVSKERSQAASETVSLFHHWAFSISIHGCQ